MMKLSCRDMDMNCDFSASGETKEEVKNKMMEHAKMEHKEMLDKMSGDEKRDMMMKMEEKMVEA